MNAHFDNFVSWDIVDTFGQESEQELSVFGQECTF